MFERGAAGIHCCLIPEAILSLIFKLRTGREPHLLPLSDLCGRRCRSHLPPSSPLHSAICRVWQSGLAYWSSWRSAEAQRRFRIGMLPEWVAGEYPKERLAGAVPGAHREEGSGFNAGAQILTPRESGCPPAPCGPPGTRLLHPGGPHGPGLNPGQAKIMRTFRARLYHQDLRPLPTSTPTLLAIFGRSHSRLHRCFRPSRSYAAHRGPRSSSGGGSG